MGLLTDAVAVYQLWNEEDSHHFGYDFTEVSSPTFDDGFVTLNGTSQYLTQSTAAGSGFHIGSSDWSMSLRFKYDSGDVGSSVYVAGLSSLDWYITKTSTERIQFGVNKVGGGTDNAELVGPYAHSTWYHLVVWFDASTQTIGIRLNDTDEDTTAISANVVDGATNFRLGEATGGAYLDGDIADVRVRKGSLWTSAEVTSLYNSGSNLPYYADGSEVILEGENLYDSRGIANAVFTNSGGVTHVSGLVGNAFDFSGSSQKIETTNHFFKWITGRSFHIVAWVKFDALGQNHGLWGQNTSSYHCHAISTNKVRFRILTDGAANVIITSTATYAADTWVRISCGYDADENETFLQLDEGTKETASLSGAELAVLSSDFHLGAIATGNYMNGQIDQFKMKIGGLYDSTALSAHYNSGSGAAEKTEIEFDYNFTGSTARRVKVEAKAAKLSGSGATNATPWLITAAELPDELVDTDETATVGRAGAPTLRASLNEDGSGQIPLKIIDFTPASSSPTAQIWLHAGTYTGATALPVYFWWIPSGSQNVAPADSAYGALRLYDDHFVAFDAVTDPTGSTGDVPDSAGNYDGTSAGSVASLVTGPGSIANAWDLDGTDDEITFGTAEMGTESTIKLWAQKDDIVSRGTYVGKHSSAGGNQYLFLINGSNNYETHIQNFRSGGSPTTAWEHLVVTFTVNGSDTDRKIYRDGVLLAAASVTHAGTLGTVAGGKEWVIGQEWDGTVKGDWFNGKIAAFRMLQSVDADIADIAATEYENQNDSTSFWDHTFAVTQPGLADDHTIAPNDGSVTVQLDTTTITQNHVLSPVDGSVAVQLDTTTITQNHVLSPADGSVTVQLDTTTLNQIHILSPVDGSVTTQLDTTSVTQNGDDHIISPNDGAVTVSLDTTTITQVHILNPVDGSVSAVLDAATLTQVHVIAPNDGTVATQLDTALVILPSEVSTASVSLGGGYSATITLGSF